MREILFRGKRVDNGEWAEGGFFYGFNNGEPRICPQYDFSQEVIPETVGQYTGKTDKNGKKIFDGDIVRYDNGTGDIAWCDYNAAWMCAEEKGEYWEWFGNMSEIEIIGNIYDNSELLEEVK